MAKLIRVEKNPRGLSYLDTYYFECSDCGKEYFRHANNKRISPYCGKCQRKHDNERQKERLKARKNQSIIDELEKIKEELKDSVYLHRDFVFGVINNHIAELKGENNEKKS